MRKKTVNFHEKEVVYDEEHLKLLKKFREKALEVMREVKDLSPLLYGSVARGDVHKNSDVDIVIPFVVPSYLLEIRLEKFKILERKIAQATPWHLLKGHIELSDATVTFPLVSPKNVELEFYKFGGFLNLDSLIKNERICGVDKRLVMIEPTEKGHKEYSILGREAEISRKLGISIETVNERVKVLGRRDKVGRTGIFVNEVLKPGDSFEKVLRDLASKSTQIKRRYKNL